MIHDIGQDADSCIVEPEEQDRSFDVVRVKYIDLDSIKSIIFTDLEFSTDQRQTHVVYNADTVPNGKLMPLNISRCPKSTLEELCATKHNSVVLKIYNN